MADEHQLTRDELLCFLDDASTPAVLSTAVAAHFGVDHQQVVGVMNALLLLDMITSTPEQVHRWRLTADGERIVEAGVSPERALLAHVHAHPGSTMADLQAALGAADAKMGFGPAMKAGWLARDKATGALTLSERGAAAAAAAAAADGDGTGGGDADDVVVGLRRIVAEGDGMAKADKGATVLSKRKLVASHTATRFQLGKGAHFARKTRVLTDCLTADMLQSGEWADLEFKSYNLKALGVQVEAGHLHPLLKVRQEFREILLELGFEEMATSLYVESSFWNFDALFQPQQHPARDAHDTFFVETPARTVDLPADYVQRVKDMHEHGSEATGSIGWRYEWSEEEARKNLLRTHTTSVSSRTLYEIGKKYRETGVFEPRKCFSIDRVFRNESLDATHLAEFHQIEGFICDRNLTLGDLIGVIAEFFRKLGMTKLRFKPAYNPYTEPSMEIFAYHEGLKRTIEVGNSGVFRPEMLAPMGLPDDVQVIAWGLGLERPAMMHYQRSNIRELVSHKIDLDFVQSEAMPRFNH